MFSTLYGYPGGTFDKKKWNKILEDSTKYIRKLTNDTVTPAKIENLSCAIGRGLDFITHKDHSNLSILERMHNKNILFEKGGSKRKKDTIYFFGYRNKDVRVPNEEQFTAGIQNFYVCDYNRKSKKTELKMYYCCPYGDRSEMLKRSVSDYVKIDGHNDRITVKKNLEYFPCNVMINHSQNFLFVDEDTKCNWTNNVFVQNGPTHHDNNCIQMAKNQQNDRSTEISTSISTHSAEASKVKGRVEQKTTKFSRPNRNITRPKISDDITKLSSSNNDPKSTESSIQQPTLLCLAMTLPDLAIFDKSDKIEREKSKHDHIRFESILNKVQNNIITDMVGRDFLRIQQVESKYNATVFTVSKDSSQNPNHTGPLDFTGRRFLTELQENIGKVQFDEVTIDWFWAPSSWFKSNFKASFFTKIIPDLATTKLLKGCIHLPFNMFMVEHIFGYKKLIDKHYQISFVEETSEFHSLLWNATLEIEEEKINALGKDHNQANRYCTMNIQTIRSNLNSQLVDSREVVKYFQKLQQDVEKIRVIRLDIIC